MNQLALRFTALPLDVDCKSVAATGPVLEVGLSRAMHVFADDGTEYIAKGVGFGSEQSQFGPANELIAALTGRELGIPLNEFALLSYCEEILFGSRWMHEGVRSFCVTTDQQLRACRNQDDVYKIVPFDVFLCNTDRHQCNLVIRHRREARCPPSSLLIANDHDRSLLPGRLVPEDLASFWDEVEAGQFIKSPVLRNALRSTERLDEEISAIEALSDETLAAVVRTVPSAWLSPLHKRLLRGFLQKRREQVRDIVRELAIQCPNLV